MILKQIIEYGSNDNNYAGLISEIAKEGGYKVNIVKAQGGIIVYIDEDEDEIKAFFASLGQRLPLSVYMGQSRVEEAASFPPHSEPLGSYKKWATCEPLVLTKLVDEGSVEYLNPFFYDDGRRGSIEIDGKKFEANSQGLTDGLKKIAIKLLNGESVGFTNEHGSFALSKVEPKLSMCLSIFCIDLNKLANRLKLPNVSLFALSSMERPFVTVGVKIDDGYCGFVRVTMAFDPLMLVLAKLLADSGVSELYFGDVSSAVTVVSYRGITLPIKAPEVLIQKDRKLFLTPEKFDSTILPIYEDTFVAYFGDGGNATFGAVRPGVHSKELLKVISFDGSISSAISAIDENGPRLIQNFEARFGGIIAKCDTIGGQYDFEKFIRASALVLGWDEQGGALAYLVSLAHQNNSPAGVKIDFILETDNAQPTLDLVKSFRTLLSYKLADVDDTILAYSIFESFADFISIITDEARKGFDAKEIVLCGDMFYSQVLSDRVFMKARNIRVSSAYMPQIFS